MRKGRLDDYGESIIPLRDITLVSTFWTYRPKIAEYILNSL